MFLLMEVIITPLYEDDIQFLSIQARRRFATVASRICCAYQLWLLAFAPAPRRRATNAS